MPRVTSEAASAAKTEPVQLRNQNFCNHDPGLQLLRAGQGRHAIFGELDGKTRLLEKKALQSLHNRIALNN